MKYRIDIRQDYPWSCTNDCFEGRVAELGGEKKSPGETQGEDWSLQLPGREVLVSYQHQASGSKMIG